MVAPCKGCQDSGTTKEEVVVSTEGQQASVQTLGQTIEGDCCIEFHLKSAIEARKFAEAVSPYEEWDDDMRKAYEVFHLEVEKQCEAGEVIKRRMDFLPIYAVLKANDEYARMTRVNDFIKKWPDTIKRDSLPRLIDLTERFLNMVRELHSVCTHNTAAVVSNDGK